MQQAQTSDMITSTPRNPFGELTAIIKKEGFFNHKPLRGLVELTIHIAIHFSGIAVFILTDNLWIEIVAMIISIYGIMGVATNAHTASHNALTNSPIANKIVTYFGYPLMSAISAQYWLHKHCIVHHPNTNIVNVDDDIDLMPFFVLDKKGLQESKGFARFYYKIQWLIFPFAIPLIAFNMQQTGLRYLISILRNPKKRRVAHWLDAGVLVTHYIAWIGLPMLLFPMADVVLFYLLRNALSGYGMFILFAPAHFPIEAKLINQKNASDFLFIQTITTLNFRAGFFWRFVCSGLDYQIEHHLFPGISHCHYPKMSKIIKKFCDRRGYPYRTLDWAEAVWKSLTVFYHLKPTVDSHADAIQRASGTAS